METLFILLALAAGALLPVQASANAQLSKAVGNPFAATTLQLGLAASMLLMAATLFGSLAALDRLADVPWWHAAGGLASALYIVSGILLFPRLGAVVTIGLFVAGQMLASVVLDSAGVLGVAKQPFDLGAAAGTGAVMLGIAAIVSSQTSGDSAGQALRRPGWVVLALVAGAALPVQGAVNALLRADLGPPLAVGATSFVVATLGMALVFVLTTSLAHGPRPEIGRLPAMPWWGWVGGCIGAYYVVTIFTALPVIGTAASIGLTVAGQQLVSVLLDHYGWLGLPRRPVSAPAPCGHRSAARRRSDDTHGLTALLAPAHRNGLRCPPGGAGSSFHVPLPCCAVRSQST